jgi:hypothetical protein
MKWAALPAPAVEVEFPCEERQAEAALMQLVGQALLRICGCVLDPILPGRAELASAFWVQLNMTMTGAPASTV